MPIKVKIIYYIITEAESALLKRYITKKMHPVLFWSNDFSCENSVVLDLKLETISLNVAIFHSSGNLLLSEFTWNY